MYYLAHDITNIAEVLEAILEPDDWAAFTAMAGQAFAVWLVQTAGYAQLRKYKKYSQGEKKPKLAPKHNPRKPHVSVARVLAECKKNG